MNRVLIKDGPTAEYLFMALRLRHENRAVVFSLNNGSTVSCLVNSIEADGNSGEDWNLKLRERYGDFDAQASYRTDSLSGFIDIQPTEF